MDATDISLSQLGRLASCRSRYLAASRELSVACTESSARNEAVELQGLQQSDEHIFQCCFICCSVVPTHIFIHLQTTFKVLNKQFISLKPPGAVFSGQDITGPSQDLEKLIKVRTSPVRHREHRVHPEGQFMAGNLPWAHYIKILLDPNLAAAMHLCVVAHSVRSGLSKTPRQSLGEQVRSN